MTLSKNLVRSYSLKARPSLCPGLRPKWFKDGLLYQPSGLEEELWAGAGGLHHRQRLCLPFGHKPDVALGACVRICSLGLNQNLSLGHLFRNGSSGMSQMLFSAHKLGAVLGC